MGNFIKLNGVWQIKYAEPGLGEKSGYYKPDSVSTRWMDGNVPGVVHVDMEKQGLVPKIFYGDNASKSSWIEDKEWWYRRTVIVDDIPADNRIYLHFNGLDTFGKVWFNGVLVGTFDNMFLPHRFDITGLITKGENAICVKFDPVNKVLETIEYKNPSLAPYCAFNYERIYLRKMQCSFGWDWSNKLVSYGIWRDAQIVFTSAEIIDPYIKTEYINDNTSFNYLEAGIKKSSDVKITHVEIEITLENKFVYKNNINVDEGQQIVKHGFEIQNPKLWWPNGYGEQNLYNVLFRLKCNDDVLDEKSINFGIRTIKLIFNENDKKCMRFIVNGKSVFCKGANWVPADSFPSEITEEKYNRLIAYARDAHYNMLRLWGGGIYEAPAFYEACDRMGIMVWQDFVFTCARYPEEPSYIDAVRKEAEYVVKSLRNHPSIVLWCGNNECGMDLKPSQEFSGKIIFDHVLKGICASLDDTRPYRPTSPYGDGIDAELINNSPEVGDWHGGAWFTYHREQGIADFRDILKQQKSYFASEFYAEGTPCCDSLKEFIPDFGQWPLEKDYWDFHTKDNPYCDFVETLFGIVEKNTSRLFGESSDFYEFICKSMLTHGLFFKEEIEHFRRNKAECGGVLFWMYNDCWPAISYSVVDYYLRPKLAHYYVKTAFSPVLLSFEKESDVSVNVYAINDTYEDAVCSVVLNYVAVDGSSKKEKIIKNVVIPADGIVRISTEQLEADMDSKKTVLFGGITVDNKFVCENIYWFTKRPGDIELSKDVLIKTDFMEIDIGKYLMKVEAEKFARFIEIKCKKDIVYISDNYCSIVPGYQKNIEIQSEQPLTKDDFEILVCNY